MRQAYVLFCLCLADDGERMLIESSCAKASEDLENFSPCGVAERAQVGFCDTLPTQLIFRAAELVGHLRGEAAPVEIVDIFSVVQPS